MGEIIRRGERPRKKITPGTDSVKLRRGREEQILALFGMTGLLAKGLHFGQAYCVVLLQRTHYKPKRESCICV